MRTVFWTVLFGLFVPLTAIALPTLGQAESQGRFFWDFDQASPGHSLREALPNWSLGTAEGIAIEQETGRGQCLHVWIEEKSPVLNRTIRYSLPVEHLRGNRIRVSALVKAKDISDPPKPWNGIKCMLRIASQVETVWPQQNLPGGSFDWRRVSFVTVIPEDCREVDLILGLEHVRGHAWFDNVLVEVLPKKLRTSGRSEELFKGHSLPRLRGAMIGPNVTDDDLLEFGQQWHANHIRWQLIWGGFPQSPADSATLEEYDRWLQSALQRLEEALPVCRKAGLLVTIDLHTPPGGRNKTAECRIFQSREFQKAFIEIWERIAARFKDSDVIWGYDLVNEPVEGVIPEGLMNWQELAEETARRVRAIDPKHAIIVEPAPWGGPSAIGLLDPIDVPGVVYSVHMYVPHQFTHQGVYDNPMGIVYPGTIDGRWYDRETLRKVLEPVVNFQREHNVHIYIGEFSAIRWAPGDSAYQYLRDCIELFEEFGWDWAYHAFREWDGWSVEHGPDRNNRNRVTEVTDRAQLLKSWFNKNKKPVFGN